ncbi:MAG: alkaline phosphatase family protein [Acidimicrobiia bacterium]
MTRTTAPNFGGRNLVNLVAEIEARATGTSPSLRLDPELSQKIPHGRSTVLVLFDGLGSHQLSHQQATHLASAHVGDIDAPFPTTTTVSLASVATGLPPVAHGLIAYQLWNPRVGHVVNTIHMTTMFGDRIDQDHGSFLPESNLWERLSHSGTEPICVQPEHFDRTPLSLALYRGASFTPYGSLDEALDRTVELARTPGAFVFLYVPHIDFAAHVSGQSSEDYGIAMANADGLWARLMTDLGDETTLIGTSDHGHIDIKEQNKVRLVQEQVRDLIVYGDARALFVRGDGATLARDLPADWIPIDKTTALWGPGPRHETFDERKPDGILFAHDARAIFHPRANDRLIGHHGGLSDEERVIPLLVRD